MASSRWIWDQEGDNNMETSGEEGMEGLMVDREDLTEDSNQMMASIGVVIEEGGGDIRMEVDGMEEVEVKEVHFLHLVEVELVCQCLDLWVTMVQCSRSQWVTWCLVCPWI